MSLKTTRLFLVALIGFVCAVSNAQTLYWVGGSGNFNDPKHWSTTSGGASANAIPNANTDVVFDNKSWANNWLDPVITFTGENYVRKFSVVTDLFYIEFKGSSTSALNVSDDFKLNELTKFNANTHLVFSAANQNIHQFFVHRNKLQSNVTFRKGNWNLFSFEVQVPYSLSIEDGTIYLTQAVVKAHNIFINKNAVNIIADKGTLFSRGKVNFKNVNYGTGDLKIVANIADTVQVNINPPSPTANVRFNQAQINACASGSAITGYTYTNVSCAGVCDGAISVSINPLCTSGPYTLNFSTISSCISDVLGVNTATGIFPPTYTLGNICGCGGNLVDISLEQGITTIDVLSAQFMPQQPTPINVNTLSATPPSCVSSCDGSAVIRLNGGNGPYTVQVNPLSIPPGPTISIAALTNTTITNLCGGVQVFYVLDSKGCTATLTPVYPSAPVLNVSTRTQSVLCNGASTGVFSVTPTGGSPGYTVTFSAGSTSSTTATSGATVSTSGLSAGTVSVLVTDTKGCTATAFTTIAQPSALSVVGAQTNVACGPPAACNGVASVTVSGGVSPYTYTWSSGGSTSSLTGLCGGSYTVNITDNNGCAFSPVKTFSITQPSSIAINPTVTVLSCVSVGNTGSIVTAPSGGNGGYTFVWSPTPPSGQGTGTITNLGVADYTLTVTDASLCTVTQSFAITTPPLVTVTPVTQSITCRGQCTGAATAVVTGGNGAPFTYTWLPISQNASVATGLCAGITYTVRTQDVTGCQGSITVNVPEPAAFTGSLVTASVTCNGANTGSIVANPGGGVTPYSFTIVSSTGSTASATGTFTGLTAGNYTVRISDAASSCPQDFTTSVQQPNLLVPSINSTSITCFGLTNGVLAGSASGGTPNYSYTWITPTGTVLGVSSLINLGSGNYTLVITDGNGCVKTLSTTLTEPSDVTVTVNSSSVTCYSGNNGALSATVTGGTPGYTLSWSNGSVNINPLTGLYAGNYTLTVTDLKNCVKTLTTLAVAQPSPIVLSQTVSPVLCAGSSNGSATVVATGGIAPYSYTLTSPVMTNITGVFSGLSMGSYIVSVKDNNGCPQSTANIVVTSPSVLSAAITGTLNSCTSCTGASTVTASGGTSGYSYAWTNSLSASVGTSSQVSSLCPGNYTVTVTDSKSCTAQSTVNIGQVLIAASVSGGTGIQCFGDCTGSVVASPSGGTAPYTYTWSSIPAQNTQTATGLCTGDYTVTVKEGGISGCTTTSTIHVASPASITVVSSQTNVACAGANTGVLSATASGGTGIKSYSWSPGGQTTSSITGLAAGTYTLRVKDGNNCTYPLQTFTITQPAPITATYATISPTACTASNGTLCVTTVSGGTGAHTYTWTPGNITTSCLNNIPAGIYTLTVKDAAGCTTVLTTPLNPPNGPTLTLVSSQSVTCFGGNNGTASYSATGVSPFTFSWSPAATTNSTANTFSANGLVAGIYNVSVKDDNGCITTKTLNIVQAPSFTVTQNLSDQKCNGGANDGTIAITPSGGTPAYSYSWSNGASTQNLNNVAAGNYTLTLSDSHSCTSTYTFNLSVPPALSLTAGTSNSVLCTPACNGSMSASAAGGQGTLTYSWLPVGAFTGSTTATILNLCANTYTIRVTDANACVISKTVALLASTLSSSVILQNATCSNSNNAAATHSVSGGLSPFTYTWTFGASTTSVLSGLGAGNYTATVTDGNGCMSQKGFTVNMPATFSVTTTPSHPKCNPASNGGVNSLSNGSIITSTTGAQGSVNYNWSPAGSGQSPTGLGAGTYTLIATDANLCQALSVVTLTNPPIMLANVSTTNPLCNSNCNGVAVSTPTNVAGAVTYTWTWSTGSANTSSISNRCEDNYTLTVKDANQCVATQTFALVSPPSLTVVFSANPATCTFSNGAVTAVASGGSPGYTYSWQPVVGTNSVLSNVAANIYTVTITDANSCSITANYALSNSNGPSSPVITVTNVACNSMSTGAVYLDINSIVGGTPTYSVEWVTPSSATIASNPLTNLSAGNYVSIITDANGCLLFTPTTVTQPNPISISPTFTAPTCNGYFDGAIALNVSGGTTPYTYAWLPSAPNSSLLTSAGAGDYTVIVGYGGAANCSAPQQTLNLPPASSIAISSSVIANNTCYGNNTGSISVNASGGTAPYIYSWSNGQAGSNLPATGLSNGNYSLIITANNGCNNTFTFNITSPPQITYTTSVVQPSCGICNGASTITASGGVGPFTYNWSTGGTASSISNLCAGIYHVRVTDAANNCTVTENVVIDNSNGITGATFNKQDVLCAGIPSGSVSVTAVGGNAPINYNWIIPVSASGQTLTNLAAGIYWVQISDAQGCVRTPSVEITAAASLSLAQFLQPPSCGSSNGSVLVIVSGGTPNYNYAWTPPAANSPSINNIGAGTYSLNVTDANACLISQNINVSNTTGPIINFTQGDVKCFGANTGSVGVTAIGAPPLSYQWSNGVAGTASLSGLPSGIITLTVTDGNGCSSVKSFTITQNPALQLNTPQITHPTCNQCNGSSTVTAFGGVSPYTYAWSNSATTRTVNSLCAGIYQLIVTDAMSCQVSNTILINNSNGITGENVSVKNLACASNCNGSATVTAIGGTQPITYQWISPAVTNSVINSLCAGEYLVQMTDAQNCVRTASVTVSAAQNLTLTPSISPPSCGTSNGTITLAVSGGTPNYNYVWQPGASTSSVLNNINIGSYTVTVTDSSPLPCPETQVFNVSNATAPSITFTQGDIKCFGANSGSVGVTATGIMPMGYQWSNGAVTSSVSNLNSGVITLTVTDGNGCKLVKSFTITENPVLQMNPPQITQPTCGNCNGSSNITAFGGTAPYTYSWSTGANTSSISGLCANMYQLVITDALGCQVNNAIIINNSNGITGENVNVKDLSCGNVCDGSATVTAVGGTQPITYSWLNPVASGSVISNQCAGVYTVQMNDANSCVRFATVEILGITSVSLTAVVSQPGCGVSNGSIIVSATGGTLPYNYLWMPGATTSSALTNVGAGSYTLTVTDNNSSPCPVTQVFNLSNNTGAAITFTQSNVRCFGANTGSVVVSASGANPPFSYQWDIGGTTQTLTNLGSGVITLTVTDNNTCKTLKTFTITEPSPIQIMPPLVTQPVCGECNGSATVTPLGGTMPYTSYVWSVPTATGTTASNLCAGLYQVNITDKNGCSAVQNVIINNSNGITGENITAQDVSCAGSCNGAATVTAVGGTSPVNYFWISPASNASSINNLCAGTYFVQMKDAEGCLRTASVAINEPVHLSLTGVVSPATCGNANGAINVAVSGGTSPYTYNWSNGATTALITNIGAGIYTVSVTDNSAGTCVVKQAFEVRNSTAPSISYSQTNINCYGACSGSVAVLVSGGTAPYTYAWSNGTTASSLTNLCEGVITFTVTDASTCKNVHSFTITENPPIHVSLPNVVNPQCNNGCDGKVTIIPSGGSLPYTSYSWLPAGSSGNPKDNLCAGNDTVPTIVYTVTITDNKGCNATTTVQLQNPPPIALTPTVSNAACSSVNNASIGVTPAGGTPNYTVSWTGVNGFTSTAEEITNLYAGSYSVTVADGKGCVRDTVIEIETTIFVQANAGRDTTTCPFSTVTLNGLNSVGATSYAWYVSSNTLTPLSTNAVFVIPGVDANATLILKAISSMPSCFDLDTVQINLYALPYVDAGPTHSVVMYEQVTIGGSPAAPTAVSFTWTPSEYLSDAHIPNPIASNTMDITYTLSVEDANGCAASDETWVLMYPAVFITNGFSPNGDGKNDTWVLDNIEQFPDCSVEIYNRWGDLLFSSKGYDTPWDGKFNGKDVPVGTYYYVINLNHPLYPKPYTGPLTIFR